MLHRIALAGALTLFVSVAASQTSRPSQPLEIERIDRIGHGFAFDSEMRRIPMDLKTIQSMQKSLREMLARTKPGDRDGARAFAARVEAAMAKARSEEERALLAGALIGRQLESADKRLRSAYDWRNRFLIERARALLERRPGARYRLSEGARRLLRESGLILSALDTAYMSECRAAGVPVPPDFSMTKPGAWASQGDLSYNMLSPGEAASVWTWTDPARRGACVALPRDNGGPGSFAGIICQSATTGKACFWDNLTQADPSRRIPAATETMVIRSLQDGRTLAEGAPCTGCHTGNNVYIMAPDDPTWAKLMRGPLTATNFTTIVEPLGDTVPGSTGYTPIAHASWTNPTLALGCSGSCHARPSEDLHDIWSGLSYAQRPPMPPACAPGGNYANCYEEP